MSGKHLLIKKIVVPIVTLALICGFTVSSFAAGGDLANYDVNTSVVVETVSEQDGWHTDGSKSTFTDRNGTTYAIEEDEETDAVTVIVSGGSEAQSTMTLKDATAKLFDTEAGSSGAYRGMLTQDASGSVTTNPTMYNAFKNPAVAERYNAVKESMKELVQKEFSDVTGDIWYAGDVALPHFFNVLNGDGDGTLRPNDTIVPAEVAKVLSATFESGLSNGSTNWYDNYFMTCSKAFTYGTYKDMGMGYRDYMENRAMTRAEMAFVIANYVDAGSGELNQYIARAKAWDIGSLAKFPDCQNIAIDDDGTLAKDLEIMSAGYIPSRYAGALAYLHDKGVFKGDVEGTMSPLNGVQRCEVFALINRVCTATTSYTQNQFKLEGATAIPVAVEQQTPSSSSSERAYVSTPYGNTQFPENIKGTDYWYSSYQTDYNEWQSREPITVRWDDPYRPRVKAGDTFIAKDGTAYVLEGSGLYVGDTEIVGVGLPIACDEHRVSCKGKYLEEFGQPSTHEFGWISSDVSTGGNKYIISKTTGEGHWLTEWMSIRDATKPTEKGTNGQRTADGYWVYLDSANDWYWTVGY